MRFSCQKNPKSYGFFGNVNGTSKNPGFFILVFANVNRPYVSISVENCRDACSMIHLLFHMSLSFCVFLSCGIHPCPPTLLAKTLFTYIFVEV